MCFFFFLLARAAASPLSGSLGLGYASNCGRNTCSRGVKGLGQGLVSGFRGCGGVSAQGFKGLGQGLVLGYLENVGEVKKRLPTLVDYV
jgi:hypothetical protein